MREKESILLNKLASILKWRSGVSRACIYSVSLSINAAHDGSWKRGVRIRGP